LAKKYNERLLWGRFFALAQKTGQGMHSNASLIISTYLDLRLYIMVMSILRKKERTIKNPELPDFY